MAENEYKAVRSKHAWFDYQGIEDELTRMAAQGWELDYISANRLSWVYKKSEPRDLQFAVVFCKDSSNFLYNPPDSQRTLEAYCEAGGWKQVEQCNKMIIFAAEKGTARPLETDEAVRLESIRQSMNRQYGISLMIMVLGLVLCIWRTFSSAGLNVHEDWFIANANLIYMWILEAYFWIWFIGIFTSYRMWLKASQRALLSGDAPADTAKYSRIYQALTRPRLLVILGAATLIIIRMIIKAGGI